MDGASGDESLVSIGSSCGPGGRSWLAGQCTQHVLLWACLSLFQSNLRAQLLTPMTNIRPTSCPPSGTRVHTLESVSRKMGSNAFSIVK
jgi:hypothetical protein